MIEGLVIVKCKNKKCFARSYYFGGFGESPDDKVCRECQGEIQILKEKEWNGEDWAVILGSEFENHNRHGWVQTPEKIYSELKSVIKDEKLLAKTMETIAKVFIKEFK
jgi:hypothetical protein